MNETHTITAAEVREALFDVMDPEIPHLSIVDLGVVRNVEVEEGAVNVELMPTFVGCPALDVMKEGVRERLEPLVGDRAVNVTVTLEEPWTTDRISERGREVLKSSGFAPPPKAIPGKPAPINLIPMMPVAECPYCSSRNTVMDNAFGPTLCRAIYYCRNCRQPFEQFKAV
jgi:ring-1,2-phenylacetyl-CoA epoxidase subunit PaaD